MSKGFWKTQTVEFYKQKTELYTCSNCGQTFKEKTNYCSNCGGDMKQLYVLIDLLNNEICGIFDDEKLVNKAKETLVEEFLQDILSEDPKESGLENLSEEELARLRDEIRKDLSIVPINGINQLKTFN